jgi:hypothetical protein
VIERLADGVTVEPAADLSSVGRECLVVAIGTPAAA